LYDVYCFGKVIVCVACISSKLVTIIFCSLYKCILFAHKWLTLLRTHCFLIFIFVECVIYDMAWWNNSNSPHIMLEYGQYTIILVHNNGYTVNTVAQLIKHSFVKIVILHVQNRPGVPVVAERLQNV